MNKKTEREKHSLRRATSHRCSVLASPAVLISLILFSSTLSLTRDSFITNPKCGKENTFTTPNNEDTTTRTLWSRLEFTSSSHGLRFPPSTSRARTSRRGPTCSLALCPRLASLVLRRYMYARRRGANVDEWKGAGSPMRAMRNFAWGLAARKVEPRAYFEVKRKRGRRSEGYTCIRERCMQTSRRLFKGDSDCFSGREKKIPRHESRTRDFDKRKEGVFVPRRAVFLFTFFYWSFKSEDARKKRAQLSTH